MQKRSYWVVSLLAAFGLLASCTSDDYTYSSMHLGIYINNATHQDATLASAMNAASPGVFCRVSYEASSRSFVFASNQGQQSKSRLNAKETEMGFYGRIGMNNGIIVGYGNLSTGASGAYTFYAYDAQCPNCFDYNALPVVISKFHVQRLDGQNGHCTGDITEQVIRQMFTALVNTGKIDRGETKNGAAYRTAPRRRT